MDWYRHLRAFEAQHVEQVEELRGLFLDDKLKAKDMSPAIWADIQLHDNLLEADEDDGGE